MTNDIEKDKNQPEGLADSREEHVSPEPEQPTDTDKQAPPTDAVQARPIHPWETELAVYPLRPATEDPPWVVRTVQTWLAISLFSGTFVIALLILGIFYD